MCFPVLNSLSSLSSHHTLSFSDLSHTHSFDHGYYDHLSLHLQLRFFIGAPDYYKLYILEDLWIPPNQICLKLSYYSSNPSHSLFVIDATVHLFMKPGNMQVPLFPLLIASRPSPDPADSATSISASFMLILPFLLLMS